MGIKDDQQIREMEHVITSSIPVDLPIPRIQVRKYIGTKGGGFGGPTVRIPKWAVELIGMNGNKMNFSGNEHDHFIQEHAYDRADELQKFFGWEIHYIVEHIQVERKTVFKVLAQQQKPKN